MEKVSAITKAIQISVRSIFDANRSQLDGRLFLFHYEIHIENKNSFAVRLLERHWEITDSLEAKREVKGKGVVGEQPLIAEGEHYSYMSSCDLRSEIGFMEGYYTFQNKLTQELFQVKIPRFQLIYPGKAN